MLVFEENQVYAIWVAIVSDKHNDLNASWCPNLSTRIVLQLLASKDALVNTKLLDLNVPNCCFKLDLMILFLLN